MKTVPQLEHTQAVPVGEGAIQVQGCPPPHTQLLSVDAKAPAPTPLVLPLTDPFRALGNGCKPQQGGALPG